MELQVAYDNKESEYYKLRDKLDEKEAVITKKKQKIRDISEELLSYNKEVEVLSATNKELKEEIALLTTKIPIKVVKKYIEAKYIDMDFFISKSLSGDYTIFQNEKIAVKNKNAG